MTDEGQENFQYATANIAVILTWLLSEKPHTSWSEGWYKLGYFFPEVRNENDCVPKISLEFILNGTCICIGTKGEIRIGRLWCVNLHTYRDSEQEWISLIKPRHFRWSVPKIQSCAVKGTFSWVSLMSHSIYNGNKCYNLFPSPLSHKKWQRGMSC